MGMYCACGVKRHRDDFKCECDWKDWYLCFEQKEFGQDIPIKKIPEKAGRYCVRCFEDGDYHEDESEFSPVEKNWGEYTNNAISNWEVEYQDRWIGYRGVYAWKGPIE